MSQSQLNQIAYMKAVAELKKSERINKMHLEEEEVIIEPARTIKRSKKQWKPHSKMTKPNWARNYPQSQNTRPRTIVIEQKPDRRMTIEEKIQGVHNQIFSTLEPTPTNFAGPENIRRTPQPEITTTRNVFVEPEEEIIVQPFPQLSTRDVLKRLSENMKAQL